MSSSRRPRQAEKLSLYKQASPLERRSLVQGRQQTSSPGPEKPLDQGSRRVLPSPHTTLDNPDLTHSLLLSDGGGETTPKTTPTNTTEVWSSELPAVHVIRHTSPRELPPATTSSGGRRFSSNFVEDFQLPSSSSSSPVIPVLHSGSDGGDGGGGEVGRGGVRVGGEVGSEGVNRETVASTNHPTLPPDNSVHEQSSTTASNCQPTDSLASTVSQVQKKKTRKVKGRVIPSRYMSSTKATPSTSARTTEPLRRTLPAKTSSSATTSGNRTAKKASKSAQKPSGRKEDSFQMSSASLSRGRTSQAPPSSSSSSSSLSSALPHHPFTPSAITSSTPKIPTSTGSQSHRHHHGSFTDIGGGGDASSRPPAKHRSKVATSSAQSDLELELLYYRLLQATYLDVKSAKSLREQEEAAKAQLHVLWEEVEGRRRECAALKRELETVKRHSLLSSVLDTQAKELSPVIQSLPQLQQCHSSLALALDATRHELPTSGLTTLTEQQLEAELSQSEQLLTDILTVTRHKVPSIVSFADSTEAAVNILDREFFELERCWKELSAGVKMQVQETSLTFEKRQRQRTLNPTPPHLSVGTCAE